MSKACTLLLLLALGARMAYAQTTATAFTGTDCSGSTYDLFAQLDAGKIIVVSFVMPCIGCVIPTRDAQTVVESYTASHPGRVEMWLADDEADMACSDLLTWRNASGIHLMPTFSNPAFVQSQYGTPAMPKIVVLGGTDHHVYDIENNVVDMDQLHNAINAALGIPTAIKIAQDNALHVGVFPNPAGKSTTLSFMTNLPGNATINLRDVTGRTLRTLHHTAIWGTNAVNIDLDGLATGVYTLQLVHAGTATEHKVVVK